MTQLPEGKSMWMRSFYGFGPEEDGYAGWTLESGRDHILKSIKDGDLLMIYGAGSKETEKSLRSYVLGFLQVDARPIRDYEKASKESQQRKASLGWADKWTYAIPVRRAWRCQEKMMIRSIAFRTYRPEAGQALGVWGAVLDDDEIAKALKLKVTEVNVFGEPPVAETSLNNEAFAEEFSPSRGFPGSFGTHVVTKTDGTTYLYLARFEGNGHALLGKPDAFGSKAIAMKIGVSNDLVGRLNQLNAGIPPAAKGKWKMHMQAEYADRKSAETVEQTFKDMSKGKLESLGGEFFWGSDTDATSLFCGLPGVSRF
ncbi:MAG: GIY-YIG nuclease family protein [Pseudomonadota bacterium]